MTRAVKGTLGRSTDPGRDEALNILRARFARGEINPAEFEERRRLLAGSPAISLRTLSRWAYMLVFGALWGYATFGYTIRNTDGSTDTGLLFVWVIAALIGSTLIGLKNRRIRDRRMRTRITLGDGAVIIGALVLIAVLPGFIGLVKGLVLLTLFGVYLYWYFKTLEGLQGA
jgi:drug/metabolite transporter (DMT)-like permease